MPPPRRRTADALISLPADVLDEILARVGLRDAVRTCVLSRAWTRRWECVPSMYLSADDGGTWKAPRAVNGILLRFPGRIRRFHVTIDEGTLCSANDWLPAISRHGVEFLSLKLSLRRRRNYNMPPTLHESVFSCSGLTVLDLSTCRMPSFPLDDWGFPNLRNLILSKVMFQGDGQHQLHKIIHTCPLLEDLRLFEIDVLTYGYGGTELVIQAPNLRRLTLCLLEGFDCIFDKLSPLHSAAIDIYF
jgi:hypothetical protein